METQICFVAYSGAGNRFIVLNGLKEPLPFLDSARVGKLCRVIEPIADGVLVAERASSADAFMRIYNRDGSEASMCGNGLRVFTKFLHDEALGSKNSYRIETKAGELTGRIIDQQIEVSMPIPHSFSNQELEIDGMRYLFHLVNTGVPHAVLVVDDLSCINVVDLGKKVRFHPFFSPVGTNVTFMKIERDKIKVRFYERGVEGETGACGTGATAAALMAHHHYCHPLKCEVEFISKERLHLSLHYGPSGEIDVRAIGPAQKLRSGIFFL